MALKLGQGRTLNITSSALKRVGVDREETKTKINSRNKRRQKPPGQRRFFVLFCFVKLCFALMFSVIQMLEVDCGEGVCEKVKAVS